MVTTTLALESAEDESEVEDVPPVLNATVWRFTIAIATSRSFAETDETVKTVRRSAIASGRMLMVAFVSSPRSMRMVENPGRPSRPLKLPQKNGRRSQKSELNK